MRKSYNDGRTYVYFDNNMIKGWHRCSVEEYFAWAEPYKGECDDTLHWVGGKIPKELMADALALIKHYKNKEVMICLYYNNKTKEWMADCPKQEGHGASVRYDSDYVPPKGYLFCGTIHSHPQMAAFWSGTDKNDQGTKPGLHIVVGTDIEGNMSKYLCSLWYNKQCYNAQDQVEMPETVGEARADWVAKVTEPLPKPVTVGSFLERKDVQALKNNKPLTNLNDYDDAQRDLVNARLYDSATFDEELYDVVWLLNDMGYEDLAEEVEARILAQESDSTLPLSLFTDGDL